MYSESFIYFYSTEKNVETYFISKQAIPARFRCMSILLFVLFSNKTNVNVILFSLIFQKKKKNLIRSINMRLSIMLYYFLTVESCETQKYAPCKKLFILIPLRSGVKRPNEYLSLCERLTFLQMDNKILTVQIRRLTAKQK